jgi:phosphohistidine phosphatase SixA
MTRISAFARSPDDRTTAYHCRREIMLKHIARIASLCVLSALWLMPAGSAALAQAEWIAAVRGGGHVIVFRHGATHRDQADTDPLNLKNVAQQRQLNDQGRELARSIGDAMRKLKVPVGQVHTSMFYRAVETGTLLGFGPVTSSADFTEGGQVVTPIENDRRAAAMRKFASTLPPAGTNIALVSHKPNIMDAFGKDWFNVREGEASIFKPDGSGAYKLVARVQASEWAKLAQASPN